jgi:hypothetical protein
MTMKVMMALTNHQHNKEEINSNKNKDRVSLTLLNPDRDKEVKDQMKF